MQQADRAARPPITASGNSGRARTIQRPRGIVRAIPTTATRATGIRTSNGPQTRRREGRTKTPIAATKSSASRQRPERPTTLALRTRTTSGAEMPPLRTDFARAVRRVRHRIHRAPSRWRTPAVSEARLTLLRSHIRMLRKNGMLRSRRATTITVPNVIHPTDINGRLNRCIPRGVPPLIASFCDEWDSVTSACKSRIVIVVACPLSAYFTWNRIVTSTVLSFALTAS